MLCEKCGLNEAQTHYKTVINGHITEHHYCETCAGEVLGTDFDPFANIFASLFSPRAVSEPGTGGACPICHATIRQIADSGRLGCSNCYSFFEKELTPFISRLHGQSAHAGKLPSAAAPLSKQARMVTRLKEELVQAVQAQEYEKAAKLRDELRALEGGETHEKMV